MNFPKNLEDGVVMSVNGVEASSTAFIFTYNVDNQSSHDVYLINALYYFNDSDLEVDPDLIYVSLGADDTLHLRKQLMPIPEHIKVESPEVPLATRIATGRTFSETVHLPIPVLPYDPYQPQPVSPTPLTATQVVFSLGYVIEDQTIAVQQVTIPSGGQFSYVEFESLYYHQRLKVSEPVKIDVPTSATFIANKIKA